MSSCDFNHNMTWSAMAFRDLVWPVLSDRLDGRIVQVEELALKDRQSVQFRFAHDLDAISGIDVWQIIDNFGIRGIASRMQVIDTTKYKPFNTFTVRKERMSGYPTEYDKRKNAIDNGWLYPYWTMQGYVTQKFGGELISFALAKTVDVIERCDENQVRSNGSDRTPFYYVYWGDWCEWVYEYEEVPF